MTSKKEPKVQPEPSHRVLVGLGQHRRAVLDFTDKDMASMEYNRIKNAGIYCGAWVTSLELNGSK